MRTNMYYRYLLISNSHRRKSSYLHTKSKAENSQEECAKSSNPGEEVAAQQSYRGFIFEPLFTIFNLFNPRLVIKNID